MKLLGWISLVALVLLALFAVANWSLVAAPATLNFLVFSVEGPLGLILLGATLLLAALFAAYALSLRTTALVETRRHMKALETQRARADDAEASRITALGSVFEREFAALRTSIAESHADAVRRTHALESSLGQAFGETGNALFANLGQIDDKLDRLSAGK